MVLEYYGVFTHEFKHLFALSTSGAGDRSELVHGRMHSTIRNGSIGAA